VPDRNSGLNSRSDAMVGPTSASTAALTPSAAVTRKSALNGDGQFRTVAPKRSDAAFALEMDDGLLARFTRRGRRAGRWK